VALFNLTPHGIHAGALIEFHPIIESKPTERSFCPNSLQWNVGPVRGAEWQPAVLHQQHQGRLETIGA